MAETGNRLLTFEVGDEEQLVIGARDRHGQRTIYQGAEPDEYALVPTSELVEAGVSGEGVDLNELRVEDLRVLGPTEYIGPDDDREVRLETNEAEISSQGASGVYGLLWIPLADL